MPISWASSLLRQAALDPGPARLINAEPAGDLHQPPNKGHAMAELQQGRLETVQQSLFEFTLGDALGECQVIENVGIANQLLREVGISRRQLAGEIARGLDVAFV